MRVDIPFTRYLADAPPKRIECLRRLYGRLKNKRGDEKDENVEILSCPFLMESLFVIFACDVIIAVAFHRETMVLLEVYEDHQGGI